MSAWCYGLVDGSAAASVHVVSGLLVAGAVVCVQEL